MMTRRVSALHCTGSLLRLILVDGELVDILLNSDLLALLLLSVSEYTGCCCHATEGKSAWESMSRNPSAPLLLPPRHLEVVSCHTRVRKANEKLILDAAFLLAGIWKVFNR